MAISVKETSVAENLSLGRCVPATGVVCEWPAGGGCWGRVLGEIGRRESHTRVLSARCYPPCINGVRRRSHVAKLARGSAFVRTTPITPFWEEVYREQ